MGESLVRLTVWQHAAGSNTLHRRSVAFGAYIGFGEFVSIHCYGENLCVVFGHEYKSIRCTGFGIKY